MSALICAPEGYEATQHAETCSRVLRYLLTAYPNTTIRTADVWEAQGYRCAPQTVSNAAARLRAGSFGLNIRSRGGCGGGYVLMVPVPATDSRCCGNCCERSVIWTCKALKGRPVLAREWCWGWSK